MLTVVKCQNANCCRRTFAQRNILPLLGLIPLLLSIAAFVYDYYSDVDLTIQGGRTDGQGRFGISYSTVFYRMVILPSLIKNGGYSLRFWGPPFLIYEVKVTTPYAIK